jgi:hypothetical protein
MYEFVIFIKILKGQKKAHDDKSQANSLFSQKKLF